MDDTIESAEVAQALPEQPPLAYPAALRALAGCVAGTARLLREGRLHLPRERVGMRLRFADGTSARVYRETTVDRGATADPCVLVVEFRLRAVRGRGHAAFRAPGEVPHRVEPAVRVLHPAGRRYPDRADQVGELSGQPRRRAGPGAGDPVRRRRRGGHRAQCAQPVRRHRRPL